MQTTVIAILSLLAASAAAHPFPASPVEEQPCTITQWVNPKFDLSRVETVYLNTATQVHEMDCGGCKVEVNTRRMGHGPVRQVTATVTSQATTTVHVNQCTEPNAVQTGFF